MKALAVITAIFVYEVIRWLFMNLVKHGRSEKKWHNDNYKSY